MARLEGPSAAVKADREANTSRKRSDSMTMQGTGQGLGVNREATRRAKPARSPATARVPLHTSKKGRHRAKTRPSDRATARRWLRRQDAARVAREENALLAPLPASYGRTRLVVLPVDPYLVHAYWEVTEKDLEAAKAWARTDGQEPQTVLRFIETSESPLPPQSEPHSSFDVGVDLAARNWYVPLWASGRSYIVQLGLKTASGKFASLAESAPIQTPRSEPSRDEGRLYMRVSKDGVASELLALPFAPFEERRSDAEESQPGDSPPRAPHDPKNRPGVEQGLRGAKQNRPPAGIGTPPYAAESPGGGRRASTSQAPPHRGVTEVDLTGKVEAAFAYGTSSRFGAV